MGPHLRQRTGIHRIRPRPFSSPATATPATPPGPKPPTGTLAKGRPADRNPRNAYPSPAPARQDTARVAAILHASLGQPIVPLHPVHHRIEEIRRVQSLVPHKLEHRPVEIVRPRFRHRIHQSARLPPELPRKVIVCTLNSCSASPNPSRSSHEPPQPP